MGIQNLNTSATNNNNINMKAFIAFSALLAVAVALPAGPPAYGHPAPVYEDTHQFMATNMLLLMTTARLTLDKVKSAMVIPHLVHTVFSFPMVVPKLLPTEPLMHTQAMLLT